MQIAGTTFYNLVFSLLKVVTKVSVSFWPTPWPATALSAAQTLVLRNFEGNVLGRPVHVKVFDNNICCPVLEVDL